MRRGMARGPGSGLFSRLAATDPGLGRLRIAAAATVSMGAVLAVEYYYALLIRPPIGVMVPMIVGAIAAMQGSGALMQPRRRQRLRVALWQPVVVGLGLVINVLARALGGSGWELGMFAGVTFAAVFVRRYGAPFVLLGLMGWTGYFTAAFARPALADVPFLLSALVIAAACTFLLSMTIWGHRPRQALRHSLRSWDARSTGVIRAATKVLDRASGPRRLTQLRATQARLGESALIAEGWLSHVHALSDGSDPQALRAWLLDAQASLDAVAHSAAALSAQQPDEDELRAVRTMLADLGRGDGAAAAAGARRLLSGAPADRRIGSPTARLARAVTTLARLGRLRTVPMIAAGGGRDFSPVVGLVPGGALTGTAGIVATVAPRGPFRLRRLALTTRQALQVTVAVALATVLGYLISPAHFAWAVLAVFIVFLGTGTRGETAVKAAHRVAGTLAGIIVAVPVAALAGGNPVAVIVVTLVGCAVGHYLMPLSYACLMFCITVGVLQMYDMMHQFSPALLGLRLAETAIGAAIAVLVAALLVPISTRDTGRRVRQDFLAAATRLLDTAADRLDAGALGAAAPVAADLRTITREADEHARRLTVTAAPLALIPGRTSKRVNDRLDDYAACSTYLRQFAVWVHGLDGSAPAGAGAAVRTLAQSARSLGTREPGADRTGLRTDPIAAEIRDTAESGHPSMQHLDALRGALQDLSGHRQHRTDQG
jgi:uncharacterized membrane protein YccC